VDQALSRLAREGVLRRLQRGLYDYPRMNPKLGGELSPDCEQVARAIARKTGSRIQPSGALAANLLGLSTQVPAKRVYLTDGASKTVGIGKQTLVFKHAAPKEMIASEGLGGVVLQALRYLGKEAVDEAVVRRLRETLSERDKQELLDDVVYATDWIVAVIERVVRGE
jgi:hypothetical protein